MITRLLSDSLYDHNGAEHLTAEYPANARVFVTSLRELKANAWVLVTSLYERLGPYGK